MGKPKTNTPVNFGIEIIGYVALVRPNFVALKTFKIAEKLF